MYNFLYTIAQIHMAVEAPSSHQEINGNIDDDKDERDYPQKPTHPTQLFTYGLHSDTIQVITSALQGSSPIPKPPSQSEKPPQ